MELARFLTLLRFNDRAECGKGTELHEGGTPHKKNVYSEGGHRHHTYFHDGGNNWGGEKTYAGRGDTCRVVKEKLVFRDTSHTLFMGKQLVWGHRTTLK